MCLRCDATTEVVPQSSNHDSKNDSILAQMIPSIPTTTLNLLAIALVRRIIKSDIILRSVIDVAYFLAIACFLTTSGRVVAFVAKACRDIRSKWETASLHRTFSSDALRSFSRIKSRAALSRITKVASSADIRQLSKSIRTSISNYRGGKSLKAITGKHSFVRHSFISKLSITDIVLLYRYASDLNQIDFEKKEFMADQSQLVRAVITAIDLAVKISRGGVSKGPLEVSERKEGDMDALYFVAVTRIFAEWRKIHLSLEGKGYRAYTTSVNFSSRDMIQNLSKIEVSVHQYLNKVGSQRQGGEGASIASPTLRQLLQFERDSGIHKNLPRVEEKSAASGLLWTKRQINYQLAVLRNFLKVPEEFQTAGEAGRAAYGEVYIQYHNWALRQIFLRSFGSVPPLEMLFLSIKVIDNDFADDATTPTIVSQLSDDSTQEEESDENELLIALDSFVKEVATKWGEFFGQFNCLDDKKKMNHPENIFQIDESYAVSQDEDEDVIKPSGLKSLEMAKQAASNFVEDMTPFLVDIESLIDQLNMSDPSRV